jgi:biotin carboxyl carrier protein
MDKVQRVGSTLWVNKDGRTFALNFDDVSQDFKKRSDLGLTSGIIKSPMPGKILKLDLKVGQTVRPGQTVCVIEAMKMEYSLKANFEGKIKEISKKVGDQVFLDEKVMLLERDAK